MATWPLAVRSLESLTLRSIEPVTMPPWTMRLGSATKSLCLPLCILLLARALTQPPLTMVRAGRAAFELARSTLVFSVPVTMPWLVGPGLLMWMFLMSLLTWTLALEVSSVELMSLLTRPLMKWRLWLVMNRVVVKERLEKVTFLTSMAVLGEVLALMPKLQVLATRPVLPRMT